MRVGMRVALCLTGSLILGGALAGCRAPVAAPRENRTSAERASEPSSGREPREARSRGERREERYAREDSGFVQPAGGAGGGARSAGSADRRSGGGHAGLASAPGQFDFYLLNLSWSPEFCATHEGSPECGARPGFVVHGLWPQNFNGSYPENCSSAPGPTNPEALTDTIPTASLVQHEWTTHGTCSGFAADAYFAQVRAAFREVRLPTAFTGQNAPAMLAPQTILAQFAAENPGFPTGSFALSCGNNYLTAIEVCLDKALHPEACQGVRSCRANAVKITPR